MKMKFLHYFLGSVMKILLDSQFLLWIGYNKVQKIPSYAKELIENSDNQLYFSLVSVWELFIKEVLGKFDFPVDVEKLRVGLLQTGFYELSINHRQILEIKNLPKMPKHKDPFDRLLIAQAKSEHCQFLTVDEKILAYPYDFIIK